jgi:putative SOS response-associated peptidase YedK
VISRGRCAATLATCGCFRASFPPIFAPIVRNRQDGRKLVVARWGMPSSVSALSGRKSDSGVTNSATWPRRTGGASFGVESRCVALFSSFSENEILPDGSRSPVRFAFDESRPLGFFAGCGRAGRRCASSRKARRPMI